MLNIYMVMLVAVVILSLFLGGTNKHGRLYIYVVSIMLFGICGLRGVRVGADLGRYETYYRMFTEMSFSEVISMSGLENTLFYLIFKLHSSIFGYEYHGVLFCLAVFEGIVFARVANKYSVNPYLTVLLYIALGYYTFIYSGLKQALATAIVFLEYDALLEDRKKSFFVWAVVAFFVHSPSIVFAPAIYIARRKIDASMVLLYMVGAAVIYIFRGPIVFIMSDAYTTVVSSSEISGVGGKVLMMLFFIIVGFMLRPPRADDEQVNALFHFMIIATIIQMFTVYGNVFERLADYYFVFSIFYLPLIFEKQELRITDNFGPVVYDDTLCALANIVILLFSIVYFYVNLTATYGLLPYRLN